MRAHDLALKFNPATFGTSGSYGLAPDVRPIAYAKIGSHAKAAGIATNVGTICSGRPPLPIFRKVVILPFLMGPDSRTHAANCCFSFWAGVMPPSPMLGR